MLTQSGYLYLFIGSTTSCLQEVWLIPMVFGITGMVPSSWLYYCTITNTSSNIESYYCKLKCIFVPLTPLGKETGKVMRGKGNVPVLKFGIFGPKFSRQKKMWGSLAQRNGECIQVPLTMNKVAANCFFFEKDHYWWEQVKGELTKLFSRANWWYFFFKLYLNRCFWKDIGRFYKSYLS